MDYTELFKNWNQALYSHFFPRDLEEDEEVSLYVDKEKIDEIGEKNELGGYDEFINLVMLPIEIRKKMFSELWKTYVGTSMSQEQRKKCNNTNLFDFATIFINKNFYSHIECPFLIYVVFAVLMGSESFHEEKGIGNYITERLREKFPNHSQKRDSLDFLFNALAETHPQFHADLLTSQKYVGLIRYQLGLSKAQEEAINKGMYRADLSEELPYEMWVDKVRDYTDSSIRQLLNKSKTNHILRLRISNLRAHFDPSLYELRHKKEKFGSEGKFVLGIYQDDYSEESDRLVLLTDVNNKDISYGNLRIYKGNIDRLGEYAQYNIHHVGIGDGDTAEMKNYSLKYNGNRITSIPIGNIVTFARCSNNYLIQTNYPQKGKETYILVRHSKKDEWSNWLINHGSPLVTQQTNKEYIFRIFGEGWDVFVSKEIDNPATGSVYSNSTSIVMDGGIRCIGMNKIYLINALPYFEFPEPINLNDLTVYIKMEDKPLENHEYSLRIVDGNKLVIDFPQIEKHDHSMEVSIKIEYIRGEKNKKKISLHEEFSVIGQDVKYNEKDLFHIDMWGRIAANEKQTPYLRGFQLLTEKGKLNLSDQTGLYQNPSINNGIDIHDHRFFLVNLFTAVCSMRKGFSVTELHLKRCIRYAAMRFNINFTADPAFYRNMKYLLINSGFINADYDHGKYQPVPPTFIKTPVGVLNGPKLYMLVGSYTFKFLNDLVKFCEHHNTKLMVHDNGIKDDKTINSLMPPVILLYNFDPAKFKAITKCECMFFDQEDIAINILRSLPSYNDYENTLSHVTPEVFGITLEEPDCYDFPRVRKSKVTGYGSSQWIEKNDNVFFRITLHDFAWAVLYCLYKKRRTICTKDVNNLLFPVYLHLPMMIQRVFYIANFGIPKKEKVFITFNDNNSNKDYYNVIKQYEIKDVNSGKRMTYIIQTITGRINNEENPAIRIAANNSSYRLFLWKNQNKQSFYARSLLVLTDRIGTTVHGFAIKKSLGKEYYFDVYLNVTDRVDPQFKCVAANEVNNVFSKFISSRGTWDQLGITFKDEYMQLPPQEEYEIEEIRII